MVKSSPNTRVVRAAVRLFALPAGVAAGLEILDAGPPGEAPRP